MKSKSALLLAIVVGLGASTLASGMFMTEGSEVHPVDSEALAAEMVQIVFDTSKANAGLGWQAISVKFKENMASALEAKGLYAHE